MQLLEKVAEMIAGSNARKKKLVSVAFELALTLFVSYIVFMFLTFFS